MVVKIPKIKVCNPSPFTKNVFCDVIDETMLRVIWNHVLRVYYYYYYYYYYYSVFSLTRPASIYYLFIGTKESVYIRKEFNSTGLVWDINMAAVSLFWDTNMAAMTSCENTQLSHIWYSLFRITDGIKPVKIAFYKIFVFN